MCEAAKVIYTVHDEVKDKDFELEMSWISASETGERHQKVPKELFDHAVTQAKAAVADSDSDDDWKQAENTFDLDCWTDMINRERSIVSWSDFRDTFLTECNHKSAIFKYLFIFLKEWKVKC